MTSMKDRQKHAENEWFRKEARNIWTSTNGPIPRDEMGRTYQIHHKDRDKRNNSLANLQCVSRKEHDAIHHIERIQIAKELGYKFGPTNGAKYGPLNAGKVRSAEARAKVAAARRGKPMAEETKRKIAISCLGLNKGRIKSSDEIGRREQTKAMKRMNNPAYGRPHQ
jgi:hypothetical protein